MALQTSGAISLNDIAGEFGGSTPHSLSEYYRGGGNVPNSTANNNIPTSGQISFSQFYSGANVTVLGSLGVSSHTTFATSTFNCAQGKTSNPMFGVCIAHNNVPAIGSWSDQNLENTSISSVNVWTGQNNGVTGNFYSMLASQSLMAIDGATATYPNGSTTTSFFQTSGQTGDRSVSGTLLLGTCGAYNNNSAIRYGINPGNCPDANGTYVFTI